MHSLGQVWNRRGHLWLIVILLHKTYIFYGIWKLSLDLMKFLVKLITPQLFYGKSKWRTYCVHVKLDFPKRQEKRSGLSCGLQVWQKGQHEEALKEPNAADCILNGSLFMKEFLIWGPQMGFKDQKNPLNHKENYIYIYIPLFNQTIKGVRCFLTRVTVDILDETILCEGLFQVLKHI